MNEDKSDQCQAVTRSMTKEVEIPEETSSVAETGMEAERAPETWLGEGPLSREAFLEAQTGDPVLTKLKSWKQVGEKPSWELVSAESTVLKTYWAQWDSIELKDGLLYRNFYVSEKKNRMQILVPPDQQKLVLEVCHDAVTAGHMGIRRTLGNLKLRFFWPGMRKSVETWIQQCATCASRKPAVKKRRAPMQTYRAGSPMERVAMDISGPWPASENGNKYILVVTDHFTRWSEAYPIPDQEARTVAEVFVSQFVVRYGTPRMIHTDQGRNFTSKLFEELCRLLGVKKTQTTAFRPQANGIVERLNKTIGIMIAAYIRENQRSWDQELALLMMAYRASPHETTGLTPNEVMLGRQVSMPVDIQIGSTPGQEALLPEYVHDLRERLQNAYEHVRTNLKIGAERQKRYYDVGTKSESYKEGDLVWLTNQSRRKGVCPKLQKKWLGPMIIEAKVNDVTYRLRTSPTHTRVVHFDKIKPYLMPEVPAWVPQVQARIQAQH
jgi:transposase InsO family protein